MDVDATCPVPKLRQPKQKPAPERNSGAGRLWSGGCFPTGARPSPHEPQKVPPRFLPVQTTETGIERSFFRGGQTIFRGGQATSKRSCSITLLHAATKSFTNFSFESAQA